MFLEFRFRRGLFNKKHQIRNFVFDSLHTSPFDGP